MKGEYMTADDLKRKWAFEIPPDKIPESGIKRTLSADVVIIGCGTSGLITANSAMDEGLDVLIITASTKPISRGGSNAAAYSKAMRREGYPRMDIKYLQREILANGNAVDQKKWYKWYNRSEEAFDYVTDIMESRGYYTAFEQSNHLKEDSLYYSPVISHSWLKDKEKDHTSANQDMLVKEFADRLISGGGRIIYRAVGLYFEKTGERVTAVIARDINSGGYIRAQGRRAVVIAAGDFSADREMMAKFAPEYAQCVSESVYDAPADYDRKGGSGIYKGDMIKAALWAGAAWQRTLPNCVMLSNNSNGAVVNRYQNFQGLLLDMDGERFMNENCSRSFGPISQHLVRGGVTFAIWDSDYVNHFKWYDQMAPDQMKEQRRKTPEQMTAQWDARVSGEDKSTAMYETGVGERHWYRADTLQELVRAAGLPEKALETIENYNRMCEKGLDTEFYKDPDCLIPVVKPPFYCHRADHTRMNLYTVLGGPRTDINMRVCDERDEPIPGLYVVGCAVGDMFAGHYTFMTQGAVYGACCITFGYLTGKYIAEHE